MSKSPPTCYLPIFQEEEFILALQADTFLGDVPVWYGDLTDDALVPVSLPLVREFTASDCKQRHQDGWWASFSNNIRSRVVVISTQFIFYFQQDWWNGMKNLWWGRRTLMITLDPVHAHKDVSNNSPLTRWAYSVGKNYNRSASLSFTVVTGIIHQTDIKRYFRMALTSETS